MNYSDYTNFSESEYLYNPHKGFATTAIHVGCEPESVHGSINVPITMSSTFA